MKRVCLGLKPAIILEMSPAEILAIAEIFSEIECWIHVAKDTQQMAIKLESDFHKISNSVKKEMMS